MAIVGLIFKHAIIFNAVLIYFSHKKSAVYNGAYLAYKIKN